MNPAPNGGDSSSDHDTLTRLIAEFREFRADLERRLKEMNAFREQILNERGQFLRRDNYEERHRLLEGEFKKIAEWQQRAIGMGITAMLVSSTLGIVIGHVFFK
jgi:chromosome segregation ATPase